MNDDRWGTSAAFLDYDHDGGLDLYCCNYAKWTLADNHFCGNRRRGVRIFVAPVPSNPDHTSSTTTNRTERFVNRATRPESTLGQDGDRGLSREM